MMIHPNQIHSAKAFEVNPQWEHESMALHSAPAFVKRPKAKLPEVQLVLVGLEFPACSTMAPKAQYDHYCYNLGEWNWQMNDRAPTALRATEYESSSALHPLHSTATPSLLGPG